MTAFGRLPVRQLRAVQALAEGLNMRRAAARAGVAERTLRRWRSSPGFMAALQATRDEAFSESLEALRRTAGRAVTTVDAILRATKTPPALKLGAAKVVLGAALQVHDALDLERRIRAVEERNGR